MEFNCAYREIARDCLVNWNGMSTDEANTICETETIDSLENGSGNRSGVGAMNSINAALATIVVRLGMDPNHAEKFKNAIINGPDDCGVLKQVREEALAISNEENFELFALASIHDSVVKDTAKEARLKKEKEAGQLRQFAPLALIGFNEVKSDLIFLQPILDRMNIHVDLNKLEMEYNKESEQFCFNHNIHNKKDIIKYLNNGEYYDYCGINEENIELLKKETEVIAEGIIKNLIANNSSLIRKGIITQ